MARVLIADDEPVIREMIAQICAIDGHVSRSAGTAGEAVDAYLEEVPGLLILDLHMPGGGAEEVLLGIERLCGEVDCPVILVSGDPSEGLPHPRVHAVLQKPFGVDTLRRAVASALPD